MRPPAAGWPPSPHANEKCSPPSPADAATPRSPPTCTSARPLSRPTSAGYSRNSACETASKRSCSPTRQDLSNQAQPTCEVSGAAAASRDSPADEPHRAPLGTVPSPELSEVEL